MSIAETLTGRTLVGRRTASLWSVLEKIPTALDRSTSAFSVGYRVQRSDGQLGFLKATDLNILTSENATMFERVFMAMESHKFERDILEYCRGSNMDKVVIAVDYGETMIETDGQNEMLLYLVFELAEDDLRRQADKRYSFTLHWSLSALHELSVAVQQLHRGQITHNDIKPANFLIFSLDAQKLADLGCATSPLFSSHHEIRHCAGDEKYAAPELLYAVSKIDQEQLCDFSERRASDLYNLGSMAYFLVTGSMLTPQIVRRMAREHQPVNSDGGWNGGYQGAMPYWREAFSRAMETFEDELLKLAPTEMRSIVNNLSLIVYQLCEPDPNLRGHPRNREGSQDKFDLARYISDFDMLRKRVKVRT